MSIFLQYGPIQGDASDAGGHMGWMHVEEIHFGGTSRRITSSTGTRFDRESSNPEFSEIHLIRFLDKASPYLFLQACCGEGRKMTLHLVRTGTPGTGAENYMQYELKNAVISQYKVCASRGSRYRPAEQLSVSFTGMEMRYIPIDDNGNVLAPTSVGYDLATNRFA